MFTLKNPPSALKSIKRAKQVPLNENQCDDQTRRKGLQDISLAMEDDSKVIKSKGKDRNRKNKEKD